MVLGASCSTTDVPRVSGGEATAASSAAPAHVATTTTTRASTTTSTLSPAEVFARAPGSAERQCVDVDELRARDVWREVSTPDGTTVRVLDVRSGEILAGNFYGLTGAGDPGDPDFVAKIYWVPNDSDVAVQSLDDPARSPITTQFGNASAGGRFFWPSGTPLPGHGRWRLTAESIGQWGCFVLTV
jgi:hypothetical protein